MQQEGMTRNIVYTADSYFKKWQKKPHASPHPLSFPREQLYRAAV